MPDDNIIEITEGLSPNMEYITDSGHLGESPPLRKNDNYYETVLLINNFIRARAEAITNRAQGKDIFVFLSGGVDSITTSMALHQAGASAKCITVSLSNEEDLDLNNSTRFTTYTDIKHLINKATKEDVRKTVEYLKKSLTVPSLYEVSAAIPLILGYKQIVSEGYEPEFIAMGDGARMQCLEL